MSLYLITIKKLALKSTLILIVVALSIITSGSHTLTALEQVAQNKVLRLITFVGTTTYYDSAKGESGFEYLLAKAFAEDLGVELEVTLIDDLDAMLNAIGGPRGHFAGAGLTITRERLQHVRFSNPYASVKQTLVYRLSEPRPTDVSDLIGGRLVVVANSSHDEKMRQVEAEFPSLKWQALRDTEMLELMHLIHKGDADYALIDSTAFTINQHIYPSVRRAFDLTEQQDIAWAFPGHSDGSLLKAANRFLRNFTESGKLAALKMRFFDATSEFSTGSSQLFMRRVNSRLTEYRSVFEQVADEYNMDWHLLAAIAYQESHWNPQAKSPTGVRGMMMLTRDTAAELNIKNRRDAEKSIRGGAEYFVRISTRIPDDVLEPDRTWFALAAYNIGLGHLEDARVLTDRHGDNPHLWRSVSKYLPLLLQKKYHRTVKHGFARGNEPVQYVRNIRHYRRVLQWYSIQQKKHRSLLTNGSRITDGFAADMVLPL
jgi:membrane-bound lytic murein transglycosylase F